MLELAIARISLAPRVCGLIIENCHVSRARFKFSPGSSLVNYIPRGTLVIILISSSAMLLGCAGTKDVTTERKYWQGWEPSQVYRLNQPQNLIQLAPASDYHFDASRTKSPIGTNIGGVSDPYSDPPKKYTEVVVWNAPVGTRFRVDKLILRWRWFFWLKDNVTNVEAKLLDGPYAGKTIGLGDISVLKRIGEGEWVESRRDLLAGPSGEH